MHSKEWFSICAMVFVVLKDSFFVFEDNCKHLFLKLDAVSIKVVRTDQSKIYAMVFGI